MARKGDNEDIPLLYKTKEGIEEKVNHIWQVLQSQRYINYQVELPGILLPMD